MIYAAIITIIYSNSNLIAMYDAMRKYSVKTNYNGDI